MAKQTSVRLTEAQIRKLASPQSFDRGKRYYNDGAIYNAIQQGNDLRADCHGSENYHLRVTLGKGGIESSSCTCPYDWGGLCKHEVALLLTYIHQPEAFHTLPPVAELLASRSREDLIALIDRMVHRNPDLLSLVELATPPAKGKPINLSTFRRQAQRALSRDEVEDIVEGLSALNDAAVQLLEARDWLNAGALYEMLLTEVTNAYDYSMQDTDYDGDVACFSQDFAEGLGHCLAQADTLDKPTRKLWLTTLLQAYLKDLDLGGVDYAAGAADALIESATEEDWSWLEPQIREEIKRRDRWAKESLVKFLSSRYEQTGHTQDANALIHELGSAEQRAFLLLEEGKPQQAVELAQKNFPHLPGLIIQLADALVEAGETDLALQFMTQQQSKAPQRGYQEWLVTYHQEHGDPNTAIDWQLKLFQTSPRLENYKKLQELAKKTGTWTTLREQILQQLEHSNQVDSLMEIALYEKEADTALALLSRLQSWSRFRYVQQVAQVAEKPHPGKAIALYRELVEQAIKQRGRESYQRAAQHLKRIKSLHKSKKAQVDWQEYIDQIHTTYSNLPALQDELNKAGV